MIRPASAVHRCATRPLAALVVLGMGGVAGCAAPGPQPSPPPPTSPPPSTPASMRTTPTGQAPSASATPSQGSGGTTSAPGAGRPTEPGPSGAPSPADVRERLAGRWRVVSATGSPTPVLTSTPPAFTFDGVRFAATPGCNQLGQQVGDSYRVSAGRLDIDRPVTTLMACVDQDVMDQEGWFSALMTGKPAIAWDAAGRLVLTGPRVTAVAERIGEAPAPAADRPASATPTTIGTFPRNQATVGPVPPAVTSR